MRNKISPTRCYDKCHKFDFDCTIKKWSLLHLRASSIFPRSILNPLIQLILISSFNQVAILTYFLLIAANCFNTQGSPLSMTRHTTQEVLQYHFQRFTISLCSAFEHLSAIQGETRTQTRCLTITENMKRGGQWVKLWLILLVFVISWYFQWIVTSASIGRLLTSETEIMKTQKNKYSHP